MPAWLISILLPVAEYGAKIALGILESKYPGLLIVVTEVKKILGSQNASPATPAALVDHLRKF